MAARARRLRPGPPLSRRSLLAAATTGTLLAGCGEASPVTVGRPRRLTYGDDHAAQYADLREPSLEAHTTVVLLHGGYWLPQYGLTQLDPMAERLTRLGYATYNVEYRRASAGGGWHDALTDTAAAIDRLAEEKVPRRLVLVGHSAGGQLAVWAASRTGQTPGGAPVLEPTGVISLSGVLDLSRAALAPDSADPVTSFMGGSPQLHPARYAVTDPTLLVPASCPVFAVHATSDQVVPAEQADRYVAAAQAAGGTAERVDVPGDHYSLIDPTAASFATIRQLLVRAKA